MAWVDDVTAWTELSLTEAIVEASYRSNTVDKRWLYLPTEYYLTS